MPEPFGSSSSLAPFSFSGQYRDDHGSEQITWSVEPSTRRSPPGQSGYEIHTLIRGIEFWGYDLDGLSADDTDAASAAGFSAYLGESGVTTCVVSGDLPCTIEKQGERTHVTITFSLDLKAVSKGDDPRPKYLHLGISVGDESYEVADECFENGMQHLEGELPEGIHLVCCATCLFSDYSPGGNGILGMRCHRSAKEQYLAVRSKQDYWKVPVTEEVMETHLCPEYQGRIAGTGYRG